MAEKFDVIIMGMGPGGEVASGRLIKAGKKVAVVERELIGGECGYWGCIPSKTLIRPTEVKSEASRVAGPSTPTLDIQAVFDYRDKMIRHLDDSRQVDSYENKGAVVIKGEGRLAGEGRVEVNGETYETDHVILATGSYSNVLPVEGLDEVTVWTNREATTTREVPGRAVIIGGGPNGVETGQWLSRLGCKVTIVQHADVLVNREDRRVGEIIKDVLEEEGIGVRVGRRVEKARKEDDGSAVVTLDDGEEIPADVVITVAGRTPRTEGIGLESFGLEPNKKGIAVDERCHVIGAPEGVWAVGDVTGKLLFTHVAQYQGRIASDNILGKERRAKYDGVPRVVFSDPEIAAVGLTEEEARSQGMDVTAVTVDLTKILARPWTYETEPRGSLSIVADRTRGVLVGAWAVAPQAGEWIHLAATAIRVGIPVEELRDSIAQFPTFTGAYIEVFEMLEM